MLYSLFIWMPHCSGLTAWGFVVANAFSCKERLFESMPCASLEHSRIQTVVRSHYTRCCTLCCALTYPLTVKCADVGVFFFFFFSSFLPWFSSAYVDFYWSCADLCWSTFYFCLLFTYKLTSSSVSSFFIIWCHVGCRMAHSLYLQFSVCDLTSQIASAF